MVSKHQPVMSTLFLRMYCILKITPDLHHGLICILICYMKKTFDSILELNTVLSGKKIERKYYLNFFFSFSILITRLHHNLRATCTSGVLLEFLKRQNKINLIAFHQSCRILFPIGFLMYNPIGFPPKKLYNITI